MVINFFFIAVNNLRRDVRVTVVVNRSINGIDCWPMTQMTTALAFSWTGFYSPHAACVDASHRFEIVIPYYF